MRKARYAGAAGRINALEPSVRELSDQQLPERVLALKRRLRGGAELSRLRDEMFALVREATGRKLGIRQFDVQVAAAVALCDQQVVQMDTGEGKTFVAPLAACLYALDGRGVHVLTANDYLVERDARMLAPVYNLLGFSVGYVLCDTPQQERRRAYQADVTYATVTQIAYDFLRDYMQQAPDAIRRRNIWQYLHSEISGLDREERCLRGRYFAIIDEVDSVLIDYARQPVSIAEPAEQQRDTELYTICRRFALESLTNHGDFTLDRVRHTAELSEKAKTRVSQLGERYGYMHMTQSDWEDRILEAIVAEHLFDRGKDYVVRGGEVQLVDQISGRLMLGQRLGGELHQALEAKEGASVRPRQSVVKKITVQSLIRSYEHLAGMTATAWEAGKEFHSVYDMKTVRFAPRLPLRLERLSDVFFCSAQDRMGAVADEVADSHKKGRPVLVGTWSVDESRSLSELLRARGVPHSVLNAVDHSSEAQIIAQAGQTGRVTVATSMAGRGVEIPLGEDVEQLGGLCVIGAGRSQLTRLDKQLAGRCGRRGKPGTARFYLSLEDDTFKPLTEKALARLRRRFRAAGSKPFASRKLSRLVGKCQGQFRRGYAAVRVQLLARDLAVEKTEQVLFGQDRF